MSAARLRMRLESRVCLAILESAAPTVSPAIIERPASVPRVSMPALFVNQVCTAHHPAEELTAAHTPAQAIA